MTRITNRSTNALTMLLTAAATAAMFTAPGCGGKTPNAAFVSSAHTFVNVTVGPQYTEYVEDDPRLTEEQKITRRNNVEAFRDAVREAQLLLEPTPAPGNGPGPSPN